MVDRYIIYNEDNDVVVQGAGPLLHPAFPVKHTLMWGVLSRMHRR